MRELWRRERVDHLKETIQWTHERQDHRQELRLWNLEREDRERDRASWKEQVEAEHKAWKEQVEAEREAWKNMVEAERQAWAREGEKWTRRREEEERHRKDVEWRRQGLVLVTGLSRRADTSCTQSVDAHVSCNRNVNSVGRNIPRAQIIGARSRRVRRPRRCFVSSGQMIIHLYGCVHGAL